VKELIIIVYKIGADGYTRDQAEYYISQLKDAYNLTDDQELKENYMIREIWLPTISDTDVKVIYPIVQNYSFTPVVNDLIEEISEEIKNDPTNKFRHQWDRLIKEIKLRKINDSQ